MVRFLPDGTLDPAFGTAGFGDAVQVHAVPGWLFISMLVLDGSGRIVSAGAAVDSGTFVFGQLARWYGN